MHLDTKEKGTCLYALPMGNDSDQKMNPTGNDSDGKWISSGMHLTGNGHDEK